MSSFQLTEFVRRRGVGKAGKAVNIRSNFFEVTKLPTVVIHHYDVSISNDVSPPVNRRIFEQLTKSYRTSDLGGAQPVFDGRKNIFSAKELPFESRTFDVIEKHTGIQVRKSREHLMMYHFSRVFYQ